MRLGRRALLGGTFALGCTGARAATLGDDGLYHEPWFVESFLDLPDDLATAKTAGQRLVVAWELRGCPFCRRMHEEVLAKPEVVAFLQPRFAFVQLDLIGAREVTWLDGGKSSEKALAARLDVRGTPTFQVFDTEGRERDRLQGFVPPEPFLAFFRRVVPGT